MSSLLQGNGSPVPFNDGVTAPDFYDSGLPYTTAGSLAVDNAGVIAFHHQGLPFIAAGRLAVALDGVVAEYGMGAMPLTAAGLLVIDTAAPTIFHAAVPYTVAGVAGVAGL